MWCSSFTFESVKFHGRHVSAKPDLTDYEWLLLPDSLLSLYDKSPSIQLLLLVKFRKKGFELWD